MLPSFQDRWALFWKNGNISTQFAAYNKITAPKKYILYPDFAHENLKGHNDRIFQYLMDL